MLPSGHRFAVVLVLLAAGVIAVAGGRVLPAGGNSAAIQGVADLSVDKVDAGDPAEPGSDLTYIITVTNLGPDTAEDVSLFDNLPAGVTFFAASPDQGSCSLIGGEFEIVSCQLGDIPAAATVTVLVQVEVDTGTQGVITNFASVEASFTSDPDPTNDSDSEDTTIAGPTALNISKTDSPDPVKVGTAVKYTITVDIEGAASNLVVTDQLPAGTTLVSDVCNFDPSVAGEPFNGSVDAGNLWSISLGPGPWTGTLTCVLTVYVPVTIADGTVLGDTAIASADDVQPISDQATTTVSDPASPAPDCNDNGVADATDIANGTSTDLNGNGIPDGCEDVEWTIISVSGIVEWCKDPESEEGEWVQCQVGQTLTTGTQIATDIDGVVVVAFLINGEEVVRGRLGPVSSVILNYRSTDVGNPNLNIEVEYGEIELDVKMREYKADFKVNSPGNSTSPIRGTRLTASTDGEIYEMVLNDGGVDVTLNTSGETFSYDVPECSPMARHVTTDGTVILVDEEIPQPDADGDCMLDRIEDQHACLDPQVDDAAADPDGEGLDNLTEYQIWTDPCDPDTDGDLFNDFVENFVGTMEAVACGGVGAWPPDFTDDGRVTIADVLALKPAFNSQSGDENYDQRLDLSADGRISIADVLSLKPVFNQSCA